MLLQFLWDDKIDCNIVSLVSDVESSTSSVKLAYRFWLLYFDGSKTQEGLGAGCVPVDLEKNKNFISCRLEFKCTNNRYEDLIQGLKKAIEFKVRNLQVFDDSEIIVRHVRNTIHCLSPHLKGYQIEV